MQGRWGGPERKVSRLFYGPIVSWRTSTRPPSLAQARTISRILEKRFLGGAAGLKSPRRAPGPESRPSRVQKGLPVLSGLKFAFTRYSSAQKRLKNAHLRRKSRHCAALSRPRRCGVATQSPRPRGCGPIAWQHAARDFGVCLGHFPRVAAAIGMRAHAHAHRGAFEFTALIMPMHPMHFLIMPLVRRACVVCARFACR